VPFCFQGFLPPPRTSARVFCALVPAPLDEGDAWINEIGDMFKVIDGEIRIVGKTEPPKKYW
jgi:hypothetical protein